MENGVRGVRAFIAYRTLYREAAETLHGILGDYTHGTAFSPYLNTHSMRLGNWMEQLFSAIEESNVAHCH